MLSLHRELIRLRRASASLSVGSYRHIFTDDQVLIYARELAGERYAVALNFSAVPRTVAWADGGRVVLATHLDRADALSEVLELRADEGVVIRLP